MRFKFLENELIICIFTHVSSQAKSRAGILENSFPQNERSGENHDSLYQNSVKKYEVYFIFCMTHNFSKCDGFTVL